MATISLSGLGANDPVPGAYIQVNFAQGDVSLGSSTYATLLMATKSAAGAAIQDTVIYGPTSNPPLVTESDAITLFGSGSPAHRMWRAFVAVNPTTPLHVICPTVAGGTPAAGQLLVRVTAATAPGVLTVFVGDESVDVPIATGDGGVATIIPNAVAQINAKTHWPVVASQVAGSEYITLTAKVNGASQANIRIGARVTGGIGATLASGTVLSVNTTLSATGTLAQDYTAALATILPFRFAQIIVGEHANLATSAANNAALNAVKNQVEAQALPLVGIRERVIAASSTTSLSANLTAGTTGAPGLNSARFEVAWSPQQDKNFDELAAVVGAVYALEEQGSNPRCNFSGYGADPDTAVHWPVSAPRSGRAPTRTELLTALNAGVTPIGVSLTGQTYIVKRITTRCRNGVLNDYRIRDAHKVTVADRFADDLQARLVTKFTGKKIGNDPAQGQRTPGNDVVTPRVVRAEAIMLLREYEALDLVENVEKSIANLQVQREASPATRMGISLPLDVIDIADQFATALNQVG